MRADFLNNAGFFIIPKHIWESIPRDQWATDPGSTGQDPSRVVGTGPFKFESWTQGQEIHLVRNDQFSPRPVWIKDVVLRIFADSEGPAERVPDHGELDDNGLGAGAGRHGQGRSPVHGQGLPISRLHLLRVQSRTRT